MNPFTRHPKSMGQTYGQHLKVALSYSGTLLIAATACIVHAILPFLFTTSASTRINLLHKRMKL